MPYQTTTALESPAHQTPTVRVLPPEEWPRLRDHDPFTTGGLPDPAHWRIIVAEQDTRIVAFTCLYEAVHYEPIWIHEDFRRHPQLFQDLWHVSKQVLDEAGVQLLFAQVPDTLPQQKRLIEKFGFQPAPGQLYLLHLPDAVI